MRLIFTFLFALSLTTLPGSAKTMLALGDSLTAGYGLDAGHAMPDVLQATLKKAGMDVNIVNAGVSGDTAAQGAARLDWALTPDVNGIMLELGANDALRGLPPEQTEQALRQILDKAKSKNLPVFILGMKAPPNLGEDYRAKFDQIYEHLAAEYHQPIYPFYLDGVAGQHDLNQQDGIHPNDKGVTIIVSRILPQVQDFVSRLP